MFFYASKYDTMPDGEKDILIVETIRKMKQSTGPLRNKSFLILEEIFTPLIKTMYKKLNRYITSSEDAKDIHNFIQIVFFKILDDINLSLSVGQIKKFIMQQLNNRTSVPELEKHLSTSSPITYIRNKTTLVNNAINKFIRTYKKNPEFDKDTDIQRMAELMKVDSEEVLRLVNEILPQQDIKHLEDTVESDDEGNAKTLMESIKSETPLPIDILQNKEMMFHLKDNLQRLSPEQQKVFKLYFLENRGEISREVLADQIGMPFRKFRNLLDTGVDKIVPALKRIHYAKLLAKIIKLTQNKYEFVKVGSMYEIKNINSSERIISDLCQRIKQ